jgi:hypothetical protein
MPEVDTLGSVLNALDQLEVEQRKWVLQTAASRFSFKLDVAAGAPAPSGTKDESRPGDSGHGSAPTPKDFMKGKNPLTDIQRIACLAYYLTKYGNTAQFKTKDLITLNSDAKYPRMGNARQGVDNATKAKLLTPAGSGQKQLTTHGEDLVEALPDQEKVRSLRPQKRRRKRPRKK